MLGAVLNANNVRLDAATLGFILEHGEAEVLRSRGLWPGRSRIQHLTAQQTYCMPRHKSVTRLPIPPQIYGNTAPNRQQLENDLGS